MALVVALGDQGRRGRYKTPSDHTGDAEGVFLELRSIGGDDISEVVAAGHQIVMGVDNGYHAGHGVLVVC